ncbi:F0F1 ATP synthase subunit alpha [Lachnospiraceae bacterium AM48-27BH]|jgi:F-type H+/Na+-transporting ATPase subunit alpha|nr:F0F1 ATP synthase subunit alpha [Lachnospiraceae bacterium AM48-27BH]
MGEYIKNQVDKKIDAIKEQKNIYAVGLVTSVTEYVLTVKGLENVAYMEKVLIDGVSEGYVNSIRQTDIRVTVVRQRGPIYIGSQVTGTGESYKAFYSPSSISHVVDIFGNDRMTDGIFEDAEPIEIENEPIPIMDRGTVKRPLETGIAGIDLIYPIGKGQRQLIIGDKKTGKTQIALDAIANQAGKDVICIYVTIGKTKKNVKRVYQELMARGAMKYTMIVAAFNDDKPPVMYLTPYVAATIAEKLMMEGKDVLLVLDDLKHHADVHRQISLLLGNVPGREAYPPDIFYTHSRLLERGCQHLCGGSVTILPIVETRGGDITGYIPTNIISITDGQIVLSKKNFDKGQKPAIHYGLSVSRLGGAVQTADMKKLGAVVRRELLTYLETREVYEMANMDEMSKEMRARLMRGARIVEGLTQYKYQAISSENCIQKFKAIMEGDYEHS